MGVTRSGSSAAARSPTRRPTCSASSRASRWAPRNIDYNGRFCMSSAAAAGNRAFGIDRGLPFPVADIAARRRSMLLVGANPAETMPPLMQYFEAQRERGGTLIVVDPRRTATARVGRRCTCGSSPARTRRWPTGCCTCSIRDGSIDDDYIARAHRGLRRGAAPSPRPTGRSASSGSPACPRRSIVERGARARAARRSAMILTARGPEQQSQGVDNVLAFINLALALGSGRTSRAAATAA